MSGWPVRALLLLAVVAAIALAAPPGLAAPQPDEIPREFTNAQHTSFGSVEMTPYLRPADGAEVPVEARFVLRDLEAIRESVNVLFAFNLKADGALVTLDRLTTASGAAIAPTLRQAVDGGRQPQAHVAPADLLAAARDGRVEVVLHGHARPTANGQMHLGAMAIAFDDAWRAVPSADGPAQLYGFTMLMATGVSGGAMPFQGQGNTLAILPVAVAAFVVAVAGTLAAQVLSRLPPATPLLPAHPAPAAVSAVARAAPPVAVSASALARAAPPAAVPARSEPPLSPPPPVAAPPDVPVFGSPASPPLTLPPRQGPRLPPGFVRKPFPEPSAPASAQAVAATPPPPPAKADPTPSPAADAGRPARRPAQRPSAKRPAAHPAPRPGQRPSAKASAERRAAAKPPRPTRATEAARRQANR